MPRSLTVFAKNHAPLPNRDGKPLAATRQETVSIVLDSLRFLQRETGLVIYGYVILENHPHLIARSENLSRDIQRFKSFTASEIIAYLESRGSKRLLELLALAQDRKPASGLGGKQLSRRYETQPA